MKYKNIEIVLFSDYRYDELVAEITCNGEWIATVSQDNGIENMILEFPEKMAIQKINLADFEKALKLARERLIKN